jgi:integrase
MKISFWDNKKSKNKRLIYGKRDNTPKNKHFKKLYIDSDLYEKLEDLFVGSRNTAINGLLAYAIEKLDDPANLKKVPGKIRRPKKERVIYIDNDLKAQIESLKEDAYRSSTYNSLLNYALQQLEQEDASLHIEC